MRVGKRRVLSRNNPSFSRQEIRRAVDNGAKFGGVPLLAAARALRASSTPNQVGLRLVLGLPTVFLRTLWVWGQPAIPAVSSPITI
jgi:hypothetical protein